MLQADALAIAEVASAGGDAVTHPTITHPTYIAYVSPASGFGVFTATLIPAVRRVSRRVCIGTYGGMVGTLKEVMARTEVYEFRGELPARPEPKAAKPKQTKSPAAGAPDPKKT